MRRNKIGFVVLLAYMLFTTFTAAYANETGALRIDPPLPVKLATPADFLIWTQGTTDVYDPHIFLVIPKSCYDALTDVTVSWTAFGGDSVTIPKSAFQGPESTHGKKIPPEASSGAWYLVNQLQEKLSTTEQIYWVTESILGGNTMEGKTGGVVTKYDLIVSLNVAESPNMLVYILGKHEDCAEMFDIQVPPTIPGFVVPELPLGSIMAVSSTLTALALFALKRRL